MPNPTVTGVATTADLILGPLGVALQLTGRTGPVAPYVRLAGGVAFLRATSAVGEQIETFIPYAGGELGARIDIVGPIGLEASIGFEAVLEQSILILGFSPGIGLVMGF
jgi:hypothetical protein